MNRTILLKTVLTLAISLVLCATPQGAFAQHGGHGGFGGFHGGGFGGLHGGGVAGFHGGSYGGFYHGGYGFGYGPHFGGYYGGWWGGSPWYGVGIGFGIGFGFGAYWGGYPYYAYGPGWYGYGPGWGGYPYYYPSQPYPASPCNYSDYRCPDEPPNAAPQGNPSPNGQTPSAKPSSSPAVESSPDYRVSSSSAEDNRITAQAQAAPASSGNTTYTYAEFKTIEPSSEMRPEVRNVVQALRAMPPDVRERQINSGRYASFSPQEKELLQKLLQSQQTE
jgi:hypothetical protein